MLEPEDIQLIKDTREQLERNRREDVILFKQSKTGEDPLTGDATYSETETTVQGRIKTLISQSGGEGEVEYDNNGVLITTDDLILNLDYSIDITGLDKVERVLTGQQYVVKAHDPKGLGEPNRHYILLELIK